MVNSLQEQRIAILLSALGDDIARPVIEQLPGDASERVRTLLDQFANEPLDEQEMEDVLDEFMRFFHFALEQERNQPTDAADSADADHVETHTPPPRPERKPFVATGDPMRDLEQLEPYQIAGALMNENARTVAVVLSCLAPAQAGLALQHLPEDVRANAFLILRDPPKVPQAMLEQVVRTTVAKGCLLDVSAVADPAEEANRRMAELLRAMDQTQRAQMIRALEAKDAAMVEQIKKLLYTFDDLRRIANRSIQKILGEVDSQSLAMALKGVEPELAGRLLHRHQERVSRHSLDPDWYGNWCGNAG